MKNQRNDQKIYWLIVILGAIVGGFASVLQAIERIKWGERPDTLLACDINSAFNCSNVFAAWQSSVFGFSNSILCLVFFTIMLGFGLAAFYSDKVSKAIRLVMHFFSVFFLAFGAWYLEQTAFVVGSLCIYCIACYLGVIAMNWAWLRINVSDLPLSEKLRSTLKRGIDRGADTFFWILYALLFVIVFTIKFMS